PSALTFRVRRSSPASRIDCGISVMAALLQSRRCAAETLLRQRRFAHRGEATPRSWPLFHDRLHADELTVAAAFRRVTQRLFARKPRPDRVLPHHVRYRKYGCGR